MAASETQSSKGGNVQVDGGTLTSLTCNSDRSDEVSGNPLRYDVSHSDATDLVASSQRKGLLSIVGTPIGNLGDASRRMVATLAAADLILCEDTRVTGKLLSYFDIHTPLQRADQHTLDRRIASTLDRISQGERIAYVSDAGMPGVSDPGQQLVDAALDAGLPVEVVPGPSAVTTALVASGLPTDHFFFEGFLPRKASAIEARLRVLASIPGTIVIYESPRRVLATLEAIAHSLPLRTVALVRELTKMHEEVLRGPAQMLAKAVLERDTLRGECVIVIGAASKDEDASLLDTPPTETLDAAIRAALAAGESKSAAAKRLAKAYDRHRSEVYERLLEFAADK